MKGVFSVIALLVVIGVGMWLWSESATEALGPTVPTPGTADVRTESPIEAAESVKSLLEAREVGATE